MAIPDNPPTVADADIRPRPTVEVMWVNTDPVQSLREVRKAVEEEAQKAIGWYWTNKRWKCNLSRAIQFFALALTAVAGIASIVVQVLRNSGVSIPPTFDSGPIASLCVGLAASLIGLDKAFGFSSGWTRYVLTATSMTKLLHEFRMDWVALIAVAKDPPGPEQQAVLIQRAKDFVSTIQSMVLQETKDWAIEFQSNMAQMEKDLKSQLDALKAQVEKNVKDKEDAARPGSIELTLTNADTTDGFHFDLTLEGLTGKFTDSVSNSKVWARINTAPGQYKVTIEAKAKGSPIATSAIVDVKPGETARPSLTL
ncbi:MAG TPA: SLATT domain-containing protein [Candidatus Acidoferrales bacterium]|jgi:hypothetical protein|nr:SLATT domain-containing protein [Candidatus Acidoferrales bacterium]